MSDTKYEKFLHKFWSMEWHRSAKTRTARTRHTHCQTQKRHICCVWFCFIRLFTVHSVLLMTIFFIVSGIGDFYEWIGIRQPFDKKSFVCLFIRSIGRAWDGMSCAVCVCDIMIFSSNFEKKKSECRICHTISLNSNHKRLLDLWLCILHRHFCVEE